MFLSTENPPHDPLPSSSSSPSSFLHLTTSSDELGQTHLQSFSIRDYAYSNRKNNIKNNWPFSGKSLQLCSAHGVTNPLPPFHKVSNGTNKFKTTASSSSGNQIVSHVHIGSGLAKLGVNQTIAETREGGCSQPRIIINNGFGTSTSVSKSKVETIVVAGTSNNNKYNKKCGRGGMVKSKEDTCGGGLVMTTTTCPICKIFSSASNTTLNAHIDQCLSVDSELPPVSSTKPNKPRVDQCLSADSAVPPVSTKPNKPRAKALMKIKTMVDIYATAKGCTLEDLDKRNGTKWASVLSHTNQVVADKAEVSKKRKVSPVGVGPVYIDDKGKKLRILTELSEKKTSTTTPLREQHEDGSKESSKSSRKRRGGKKEYKYLKLTNLKANTSEIPENQRGFCGEGSSKGHRRIYNQRMLAKRGLISKKLNEKEDKFYALSDQPSEDDDDDDSWSGEERLVLRGTDSSPSNKQKLRNKTMFGSKKEEKSLARAHLDTTVQFKKRLASIQEDKYPPRKNVRELSPRATSIRKLSAPFVSNGWRRLSLPVELKKAPLSLSDEEEEETLKWESEMTQERELSDDDYVSGDDSPSFSRYDDDDDDEESSDEEEEDDNNNNNRANALEKRNVATPSNETIPTSERAMYYYSEQAEEMICEEDVRFDSEVRGKGSLFIEVDTIPIPGPPGSFLPSPRDMCYDENLGNSSVITSQIQSFDRNSSESPVSNFASGRLSFCVPSHHETSTVEKTEPPPRLGSNDHESCCCCQRKERISEGIALNHQTSPLLQRRAAAYSSTAMNFTKSPPTRLDTNHPSEQPPYMIQQSKFSNRAVVPPSPNPVLRLMGKDLMVMNQVEADKVEASRDSLKPSPQFLDPFHCAGTGLYFNTSLCLRNSVESTHQPQTQTQATPFSKQF
ncbi:hypothetical protein Bca4012_017146 [Brassica carinata]|uniref:Uncharacterized protein n=1 Tax=Brassica carinata TaxID=52824 RepID=A0A8X7WNW5_BRACI|nr:hypothetical protein Bca52824_004386 [Brassica carinata]